MTRASQLQLEKNSEKFLELLEGEAGDSEDEISEYYAKLANLAARGLANYRESFYRLCDTDTESDFEKNAIHRLIEVMLENNYDIGTAVRLPADNPDVDPFSDSPYTLLLRRHFNDPASVPVDLLLRMFNNFPIPPSLLDISDFEGDDDIYNPINILNLVITADEDSIREKYKSLLKSLLCHTHKALLSIANKNSIIAALPEFNDVFLEIDSYYPGEQLVDHYPIYLANYLANDINAESPIGVKRAVAASTCDLIKEAIHQNFDLDYESWDFRLGAESESREPDFENDPFYFPIIDPIIARYCSDNSIPESRLKEIWQSLWTRLPEGADEKSKQLQLQQRSELQRDLILTAQKIFCEYLKTDAEFKTLFEEIETKPFQELVQSERLLNNLYLYGPTMEANHLTEKSGVTFLRDRSLGVARRLAAVRSTETAGAGAGDGGGGGGVGR